MATATFTVVNDFYADVHNGVHDLSSDQLVVTLCNSSNAPTATDGQLTDLTTIDESNLSSTNITTTSSTQTSGTYSLILEDLTLTASGAVPTFRYVAIYNNTATNDELIGYLDYGSDVDMSDTETFLIDFSAVTGALQAGAGTIS
jgi:hypothetical protein